MKSYNHLFERLLDPIYIECCIHSAAKGKTSRPDVQDVLNNIDYHIRQIQGILLSDSFCIRSHIPVYINEDSCKKVRKIIRPDFKYETIIQHMIVGQLQPIIMKSLYEYSCASIPGKGGTFGKKYLERFLRKNKDKKLYILKLDIRKFFDHIDRSILMNKLKKIIRDKRFLSLLYKLIYFDAGLTGIPLGFYSSQWFANLYLTELDYYIKQILQADFYMRYMDDMVIISTNKRKLHKIKLEIELFLFEKLHLVIKKNWQLFRFSYHHKFRDKECGRFIDFMGFQFRYNRTTLRKITLRGIRRKAYVIGKKRLSNIRVNWYVSCQMISKLGWLSQSQTYGFYQRFIQDNLNVKQLKRTVSSHFKKLNKRRVQYEIKVSCI